MERRLETELKELKSQILEMGSHVEEAIEKATEALQQRNVAKLEEVYRLEDKINKAHMDIDNACLGILARQAPVAASLRLILAIIKINTDLERMGDQSVNISQNAEHYLGDQIVDASLNLPRMATLVRAMVRDSLDAFMKSDSALATKVLESDDAVDELRDLVFEKLVPYMKDHPNRVEAALDLILISRNLERLADHATNIAEDVIFAYTGEDVRHPESKKGTEE
jgi:phosphate transport system protein